MHLVWGSMGQCRKCLTSVKRSETPYLLQQSTASLSLMLPPGSAIALRPLTQASSTASFQAVNGTGSAYVVCHKFYNSPRNSSPRLPAVTDPLPKKPQKKGHAAKCPALQCRLWFVAECICIIALHTSIHKRWVPPTVKRTLSSWEGSYFVPASTPGKYRPRPITQPEHSLNQITY